MGKSDSTLQLTAPLGLKTTGRTGTPAASLFCARRAKQQTRSFRREINIQSLRKCFRPFVQSRQRGVQHFTRFQAGQRRRVDPHTLGYVGQSQSPVFPHGFDFATRLKIAAKLR